MRTLVSTEAQVTADTARLLSFCHLVAPTAPSRGAGGDPGPGRRGAGTAHSGAQWWLPDYFCSVLFTELSVHTWLPADGS